MSRTPPAWPRPDGGGGASAPTSRSPSGPPSRVGARPQRARVRRPSSAPPWGRSTGHRRTAASQAARATAPEARGAARSARCRCADASHPGPRARVRCSGRVTARSSAGQSSSPPRHPRSCDPARTTRSPERASSRSDPGPTGASLPDRPRSDDQQPAPWLASAPQGAPAYPLPNNPGILNPSPSPGARITGRLEIDRDRLPVPEHLELRVGARVMAVKNDPEGRWYNGSLGTVKRIDEGGVFVRFDRRGDEHLVSGAEWTKVRQEWNEESQTIENQQIGAYRQIPLIPAWAITIHKAQGLTLDDVRLDLGSG